MRLALLVLFIVSFYNLHGQTCCSGGVPLTSNIGFPKGEYGDLQFSLSYDVNQLKKLKVGDQKLQDSNRERSTRSMLFKSGYTFNYGISIDILLSYVFQERIIYSMVGDNTTVTKGIGDGVVLVKYRFPIQGTKKSLVIGLGAKLPLGASDIANEYGISLPADLQPGSGAWDILFWGLYSKSLENRQSTSLSINTMYRLTGVNQDYLGSLSYEFGDELQVILSLSDQLLVGNQILDTSLSVRFRDAKRDSVDDAWINATGGQWLFLVPGLQLYFNPALSVSTSFEVPIYSYVNSTQLSPSFRLTLGLYYRINN